MSVISGLTSLQRFADFDPDTSSWRTCATTFPWDSTSSPLTFPAWGIGTPGALYALPTSALATSGPACSSWLPTPNAERVANRTDVQLSGDGRTKPNKLGWAVATLLPTPAAANPNDGEDLDNWQRRRDEQRARGVNGNGFGTPLSIAVRMLPTPTVGDSKSATNSTAGRLRTPPTGIHDGDTLTDWARKLPTPTARDHQGRNQRDGTCLPGAITHLRSPDTNEPSAGQLPLLPMEKDG